MTRVRSLPPRLNIAGSKGAWGVLIMTDTPVVEHLAQADVNLQEHAVFGTGHIGHLGRTRSPRFLAAPHSQYCCSYTDMMYHRRL
jgi:hypothetical protein